MNDRGATHDSIGALVFVDRGCCGPHAGHRFRAASTRRFRKQSPYACTAIRMAGRWRLSTATGPCCDTIVRERVIIRVSRQPGPGRCIDLSFRFTAMRDDVQVARRDTTHYGGLNLRLSPALDQQIETLTDGPGAMPRRAWRSAPVFRAAGNRWSV